MSEPTANRRTIPRQSAAIPIRRSSQGVEICVIRRKGSTAWGIPKGFIDPGDTEERAALNEAYEEAGLSGRLLGETIGMYEYKKYGASLTVAVFVMEVLQEEAAWREMRFRERRWCSLEEARALLANHPVRWLLEGVAEL